MNILKYKGYEGSADLDMERQVCTGRLLFVDDLVTYEASTPAALQQEFETAVDDYLETCAALNRAPKKPLKGQFNVRIPPGLHMEAVRRAMLAKASLNDVVVRALEAFLTTPPKEVKMPHEVVVTVQGNEQAIALVSKGSQKTQWTTRHASH